MKTTRNIGLLLAATVAIQLGVLHPVRGITTENATTAPREVSDQGARPSAVALPHTLARVDPRPRDAGDANNLSTGSSERRMHLQPTQLAKMDPTPRGFIPNVGQVRDAAAKFVLRDRGVSAYFTEQGFVLWNGQSTTVTQDGREVRVPVAPRWSLVGAKPVEPVGGETFPHTVSFFRGNDSAKWRANVPAYRDLRYPEILPGVELRVESLPGRAGSRDGESSQRLTGEESGFEYRFHVQPHTKPDLRFHYGGITGLEQSLAGDLIVRTAAGHFTESRPIAFQWIDGAKRDVASSFEIVSANEYRIVVGAYDERHELVIDPVLDWATSFGGSYHDQLNTVKFDPSGDLIVAGVSFSTDLPSAPGFAPFDSLAGPNFSGTTQFADHSDIYIAKFSPDGTELRWAGYIGGNASATSEAVGRSKTLAIESNGDFYLAGHTKSPDFPIWPAGNSAPRGGIDSVVMKIKADGSAILWSGRVGGSADDYGWAVSFNGNDLYLAGVTTSADFNAPTTPTLRSYSGLQDGFVVKLNAATGAPVWSSYLGGSLDERVGAASADTQGVIIYGDTDSSNFHAPDFPPPAGHDRTLGGDNDAFLTRFDPAGNISWSTYLGGSQDDTILSAPFAEFPLSYSFADMARDSAGNIIAVGLTFSPDFPGTAGSAQPARAGANDAFVAKVAANGSQVLWATYLGGSGQQDSIGREESAAGVAVNERDEIFVAGVTLSPNFPTTPDALKTTLPVDGTQDVAFTKLSSDGKTILYSTYVGNSGWNDGALGLDYGHGRVAFSGWHYDSFVHVTPGSVQQDCNDCGVDTYVINFLDAYIAHDGFESGNYAGGDGWAGGWTASGDASILTSAGPHSGTRHVRLRRGTGLLSRTVNIPPGATSLKLGFWTKVSSFESTDNAVVRVTPAGGSPITLITYAAVHSDNTYHYDEFDLSSLVSAASLQITFDANMSGTDDQWYLDDIRVTGTSMAPPPPANPLHSGDLDRSSSNSGKNSWKATVVVTMHDGNESPVQGATVFIQWGGGASGTANLTTDANGRCTFTSGNISKSSSSATFSITGASHATLTYSAAANHDPDGDSNGTSITVSRP